MILISVISAILIYAFVIKHNNKKKQQILSGAEAVGDSSPDTAPFEANEKQLKKHVKRFVTGELDTESEENSLVFAEQRENYKNKYFEFGEHVNQTSNPYIDPVDRADQFIYNDYAPAPSSSSSSNNKIKNIYDDMVKYEKDLFTTTNTTNLNMISNGGNL